MSTQFDPLAALRHRTFRDLWLASSISNTGAMIQLVGAAWMMTQMSTSPVMVALVQTAASLPLMIGSLPSGVLADNYDRRRVMLFAQVFMSVAALLLAGLSFADRLTPWMLLAFTFFAGCGTALHNPSWQAAFSDLVPKQDLPSAVTTNGMGMNATRSLGPAVGGVIVATAGVPVAFALNAASYLALMVALLRWRPAAPVRPQPRERYFSAMAAGVRYFILSPQLIVCSARGFTFSFGAVAMQAMLPLVASDKLQADALVFGVLLGAFGAGAVIGGLNGSRIRARLRSEAICRCGFVLFAGACPVVALSDSVFLTVSAVFLAGAAWINVMSLINMTVQLASPRWVLGRSISLYMTFIFGGMTLGSWIWGSVAEVHGVSAAFLGCSAVLLLGAASGFLSPLPQYGTLDLDPTNRSRQPVTVLVNPPLRGAIKIMVEYLIDDGDIPEFLSLMATRRRIHSRDGARHWELGRDLARPEVWIESYRFATWTDYVRHNDRRTTADDVNTLRLFELNRTGANPAITRLAESPAQLVTAPLAGHRPETML